jgi:hypothetical protein
MKRRAFVLPFALLLSGLVACATEPLYQPDLRPGASPAVSAGETVALFSLAVRSVAVDRSQGLAWTVRLTDEDYKGIHARLTQMLADPLELRPIPTERILNHSLVREGHFRERERFYLNSLRLPLIIDAKDEELMLRTARSLEARYYATALVEVGVSRFLLFPAHVSVRIVFQLHSAEAGVIFRTSVEQSATAEPYEGGVLPIGVLETYEPVMLQTARTLVDASLADLAVRLPVELRVLPGRSTPAADSGGDGSANPASDEPGATGESSPAAP